MKIIWFVIVLLCMAKEAEAINSKLKNPSSGVVCDKYICADRDGISVSLTEKYIGKDAGKKLRALGRFDRTEFTFSDGTFCDTDERVCREDRYFGPDGRNGKIENRITDFLFGNDNR